jgi:hypothetical protein
VSPVRYELEFYIPEDAILHSHRRKNIKSYTVIRMYGKQHAIKTYGGSGGRDQPSLTSALTKVSGQSRGLAPCAYCRRLTVVIAVATEVCVEQL